MASRGHLTIEGHTSHAEAATVLRKPLLAAVPSHPGPRGHATVRLDYERPPEVDALLRDVELS
eukprot:5500277-Prymnesium_polylepis.1